jgi:TetR/AcrR family transcriptional regulator, transcriptional repressor for nem operon
MFGNIYLDSCRFDATPERSGTMRKSRQEAAQTRERIVSVAAQEFNKSGVQSTGLAAIMEAAGLTHGGFYKHFSSKDQLVAEALEKALEHINSSMMEDRSLKETVGEYLSTRHRDSTEGACPLAALGSELRHVDGETREVASSGLEQIVTTIASHLRTLPPREAKARAQAILAAMVGGMVLSRVVTDKALSESFLRVTKAFVLKHSLHGPMIA